MADDNDLMTAYVEIKADLSGLFADIDKMKGQIESKIGRPTRVKVDDAEVKRLGKTVESVSGKARKDMDRVGRPDFTPAERGIDSLLDRFRQMRGQIDRVTDGQRKLNAEMARQPNPAAAAMLGLSARSGMAARGLASGIAAAPGRFMTGGALAGGAVRMMGGGIGPTAGAAVGGGVGYAVGGLAGPTAGRVAGVALGSMGAAAGKVLGDGVMQVEDARKTERMLAMILGDAKQAKALFKELSSMDTKIPIDMASLSQSAKALALAGFEASEIPDKMRTIIDAASASTAGVDEGTQRIVQMLSQIKAKGIASMEELNNLQNMGLPIAGILKEKFGKSIQEIAAATKEGTVGVESVIDGILSGLNAKFAGAVGNEINTMTGQVELLKAKYNEFAGAIAEPIFDPLLNGLKALNEYLESDSFAKWAAGVKAAVANIAEGGKVLANSADSFGAPERARIAAAPEPGAAPASGGGLSMLGIMNGLANLPSVGAEVMAGLPTAVREEQDRKERERKGIKDDGVRRLYSGTGPNMVGDIDLNKARTPEQQARLEGMNRRNEMTAAGSRMAGVFTGTAGALSGMAGIMGGRAGSSAAELAQSLGLGQRPVIGPDGEATGKKGFSFRGLLEDAQGAAERIDVRESVARRKEADKAAAKAEVTTRQATAQRVVDETIARGGDVKDMGLTDREKEMVAGSKFGVSMKRGEDGQMMPTVALKEAFKDLRGPTQATGLDGLNRLMQGQVDAANDRKIQQDQKTLLESVVEKLQKQIELETAKGPGGPQPAVIGQG